MDLKHDVMNSCIGYKYDAIIETLKQLTRHYESCKNISETNGKEPDGKRK